MPARRRSSVQVLRVHSHNPNVQLQLRDNFLRRPSDGVLGHWQLVAGAAVPPEVPQRHERARFCAGSERPRPHRHGPADAVEGDRGGRDGGPTVDHHRQQGGRIDGDGSRRGGGEARTGVPERLEGEFGTVGIDAVNRPLVSPQWQMVLTSAAKREGIDEALKCIHMCLYFQNTNNAPLSYQ
jgi:hypothetical protein